MALLKTGGFELFAREKLEEILEAIELSMNDLLDSKTAVRIGKLKGVQALAYGGTMTAATARPTGKARSWSFIFPQKGIAI